MSPRRLTPPATGDFSVADELYHKLHDAHWEKQGKQGMNAYGYTKYEQQAIDIVVNKATELGMEAFSDLAGNTYLIKRGLDASKTNVIVSHVDTVEAGGAHDGRDGVIAGLVVADWLKDKTPPNDLCVMIARSEESDINGLVSVGAKLATNDLSAEKFRGLKNRVSGRYLTTHMEKLGIPVAELEGRLDATPTLFPTGRDAKSLIGFLAEAHIEQGNYTAKKDINVGVVTGIRGNTRFRDATITLDGTDAAKTPKQLPENLHTASYNNVHITGQSAHSGATFEEDRADAVRTYAKLMRAAEDWCKEHGKIEDVVFTPGHVESTNEAPTTVANNATFSFSVSSPNKQLLKEFDNFIQQTAKEIVKTSTNKKLAIEMPEPSVAQAKPLTTEQANQAAITGAYRKLITAAEDWYQEKRQSHDVVFTPATVRTQTNAEDNNVTFSFEIRSTEEALLREFDQFMQRKAMEIMDGGNGKHVHVRLPNASISKPAIMDDSAINHAQMIAEQMGINSGMIVSGAGHDTAQFANSGVPSVMLFIKQDNPISHNPEESHNRKSFEDTCRLLAGMVMLPSPSQAKNTSGKSFTDYIRQQGAKPYIPGMSA